MSSEPPHRWKFIRAGGVDQVVIRNGGDIVHLEDLDQKLWVALACPTRRIEMDPRTLDLIDTDNDGRIRPPELIAASHWVRDHFVDPDLLIEPGDSVPLAAIRSDTDSGRQLSAEIGELLALVGRPAADVVTLADIDARRTQMAERGINGDGVVSEAATDDEATRSLIRLVIEHVGSVSDRDGRPGIDQDKVDAFFAQASALADWRARPAADPALAPLGDTSRAAAAALAAVRAKVDDYFTRCRVAGYDPSAVAPLNPAVEQYKAMAGAVLDAHAAAIAELPLATAAPKRPLPLGDGINPAWAERIAAMRTQAAEPLLGQPLTELAEADWATVKARLAPCSAWLAECPDSRLDADSDTTLNAWPSGDARSRLEALIARDKGIAPSNERVVEIEKLLRLRRDFVHLLNNFVSFSEFYSRRGGIFEAGRLYLDARSCELAVRVDDVGSHAKLAGRAKAYLAYCECRRGSERMSIVAAFTAGDVDFLFAGRNGVFYDRAGHDWDATITQVIENPISIRQAVFLPYKKFLRMVEEQVAKRAAFKDKQAETLLGGIATRAVNAPGKPAAIPAPAAAVSAAQRRIDVGTVAALGVALGSISAVLVGVFAKFVDLGAWIPVALLGILLAISGPSVLIAWLKLRQRSLGPLLDASGWAINGRMRINVPLGGTLTRNARVPAGSERRRRDPYRQTHTGAALWLLAAVAVAALVFAWQRGLLA